MSNVTSILGQSALDLCMQTYTSLDLFVTFAIENSIDSFNTPIGVYYYNQDNVYDQSIENKYAYKTGSGTIRDFSSEFSFEFS